MKIAQIVASYHPRVGGVEKHVRQLAEGCADAGDEVTVVTHQVGSAPAVEDIDGVRVLRFPLTSSLHNYPLSLSLFRHLKAHKADFDLVHVHSYHTLVGHSAVGSGLPFVFTPHYHGTGHTRFRALLHRLYRSSGARLFMAADAVICVSTAERDLIAADFPNHAGKLVTIPNGIGPTSVRPESVSLAIQKPLILTVGRLERYKNVDLIIEAFCQLQPNSTLVIVGDGPDRARLERKARAAAEPDRSILFTGRVPETMLSDLLSQANVVVSASDHEAFGLSLAEGLAYGTRAVASPIPAHAELANTAGVNAPVALVDPRDTGRFADGLAASIHAGRVPAEGLRLVPWTDVVRTTRALYLQVLRQDHRGLESSAPDTHTQFGRLRNTSEAQTESA